MIYLDTSVVLAQLLVEDRIPPATLWSQELLSSRLLQYEAWVTVNARGLADSHGEGLRTLLGRISFLELEPRILARALERFSSPVRTLDALHLASFAWLRDQGQAPKLATYDEHMQKAAKRMQLEIFRL